MSKPRHVIQTAASAVLGLLLASPASAAPKQGSQAGQSGSAQMQRSDQGSKSATVIQGRIDAFRHLGTQSKSGQRDRHSLVRLQLKDGRTVVADLGPKRNLDRLDLNRGDQIQLRGHRGQVSGRSVFIANQLQLDGKTIQIARGRQDMTGRSPAQRSRSGQSRMREQAERGAGKYELNGTIEGFRKVNLRSNFGQRSEHSLICVKLQSGKSAVVDLGPRKQLSDLDLQKGDRIRIQGRRGTVDGRWVLMADRIRVGQQTFDIQRQHGPSKDDTFAIRGTVEGYQLVTFGTGKQQQALLKLRLLNGRTVLIDAGQKYAQGELDLKNLNLMDRVTIQGHRKNVGGRTAFVVDTIRFQDPSREYVRERESSRTKQSSQERQQRQRSGRSESK